MKKTLMTVIVLATFCTAILFASGKQEEKGPEKVKLVFYDQIADVNEKIVPAFEADNPGIEIEYNYFSSDDMRGTIRSSLASGSGPDIFYYELGAGHVQPLIDAGFIYPLDDVAEKKGWNNKLTSFSRAEATHQGTLWGLPNETEFIAVFYNKSIFKKAGVSIPASWDEFDSAVKKIEAAGFTGFIVSDADKWQALHRVSLGYQWGNHGQKAVGTGLFEEGTLNGADFAAGFEKLLELDRDIVKGVVQKSYNEASAEFLSGKAAMIHNGTWYIGDIMSSGGDTDNYGLFVLPRPGSATPDTVAGNGGGWYINAGSKHIEEAVAFLDYQLTPKIQEIWLDAGRLPATKVDPSAASSLNPLLRDALTYLESSDMGYFIHHFVSPDTVEWIRDGYQALILGDVTPSEYVEKFNSIEMEQRKAGFRP